MRILLISSQDYIHHPLPSRHHYIFERLAERHEIHVAHFHVNDNIPRETKLTVEETTMFPLKNLILHYTLNSPYHFYKFDKIIKENNIDIIVAAHVLAGTAAILAGKRNNIPVLFDLKDWFPDSAAAYFKNKWLKKIVHDVVLNVTKYNLSNSTKITTVSPNLIKKLKDLGYVSQLITNGVDTKLFKPMPNQILRHKLGISDTDFVIGFAGSIERWYNLQDLFTSYTLNNYNIKLLFVGGSLFTNYKLELEEMMRKYHMEHKVIFTGFIPYNYLPDYINCMDVCTIPLAPTQWKNIALPNKFFEYTACGKPILTTNIPNITEFNCSNTYVYNDKNEFEQHLKIIMDNKPKYNIDFTKQDWDYKAKEMENILQDLIDMEEFYQKVGNKERFKISNSKLDLTCAEL
jgi:glycosyltransferase involved in cell wall biosynthesis